MKFNHLFILILATAVSACSSKTEPTRHYQLPDSAFRLPENAVVQREIALKVVLAEHLNGNSLLYQTDDVHVNFAQKNLWASPLPDAIAANLANKLNEMRGNHVYVPQKWAQNPKGSLKVYIDRFQGTHHGVTEISGHGQWDNGVSRPFVVRTPQVGDGYAPMVESLNMGLADVAKKLAY